MCRYLKASVRIWLCERILSGLVKMLSIARVFTSVVQDIGKKSINSLLKLEFGQCEQNMPLNNFQERGKTHLKLIPFYRESRALATQILKRKGRKNFWNFAVIVFNCENFSCLRNVNYTKTSKSEQRRKPIASWYRLLKTGYKATSKMFFIAFETLQKNVLRTLKE